MPPTKKDNDNDKLNIKVIEEITIKGKIKIVISKNGFCSFCVRVKNGPHVLIKHDPPAATSMINNSSMDWFWFILLTFIKDKRPKKDPINVDKGYKTFLKLIFKISSKFFI